jgi:ATP-dependent RNA helicase DOB1
MVIPKDLLPLEIRENTLKKVSEGLSRFPEKGSHLLNPEEDFKVYNSKFIFHSHRHIYISYDDPDLLFSDSK